MIAARPPAGGRPLRFLALFLGGWTGMRAVLLWPAVDAVGSATAGITAQHGMAWPKAEAGQIRRPSITRSQPIALRDAGMAVPIEQPAVAALPDRAPAAIPITTPITTPITAPVPVPVVTPDAEIADEPTQPPPLPPTPRPPPPGRLSGSAWAIMRGGARGGLVGGQLGASQGGVRLLYALGDTRRVALTARLASPVRGNGFEAAAGIEWRLPDLPVRVIAEHRVSLDGGRGGFALGVIGGGERRLAPAVRIEAYGQAGLIGRDGIERFADGAVRIGHAIVRRERLGLDLGVGAWGGAQRGATRLDVGPSAGLVVPVGRAAVRMTLDWRRRIGGSASPGSGPALSIGSDF